jgi:hypothetical protein
VVKENTKMGEYRNLPEIGMSDPGNTGMGRSDAGGGTKVNPTSKEGDSYKGATGYGFMTNDASMKAQGISNGTTLPVAKPITPMTYDNPNNTAA